MKKFTIILAVLIAVTIKTYGQIPNSGFENWTNNTVFIPSAWHTFGKISRITPGQSGTYAIKFERDSIQNAPGAVLFGNPNGASYSGGIPFADRPDSLVGFFKYDIPAGDSGLVLINFKLNGVPVSNDVYYITGSHTSGFIRLAFKINYLSIDTPDSLIMGVASTNPDSPSGNGYVIADHLSFTNTSINIPNGDFETWFSLSDEEPDNWFTPNINLIFNDSLSVTKTTDHNFGDYAIRIESVNTPGGLAPGFALAGPQGGSGPKPGFPVSIKDSTFNGYYKFFPHNNDTMTIGVMMFESGIIVGNGFIESNTLVSTYTPFTIPIDYNIGYTGTPDSATIVLLTFAGGNDPHGNSVLFIDDLSFDYLSSISELTKNTFLSLYPNPASDIINLNIDNTYNDVVEVNIYNLIGELVKSEILKKNQTQINITDLSNGLYMIAVKTKNLTENKKLIIQR